MICLGFPTSWFNVTHKEELNFHSGVRDVCYATPLTCERGVLLLSGAHYLPLGLLICVNYKGGEILSIDTYRI